MLSLPFQLNTVRQTTENVALLDSGATKTFIDEKVWKELKIGHFRLNKPLTVHNVDSTENKQGKTEYLLHSEPTPTFSHTAPSTYTPSYDTPNTWDCITVVSDFPDVIPAHPLDIFPRVAPEPVTMHSLMHSWPYTSHHFTEFCPQCTDGDSTELWLAP